MRIKFFYLVLLITSIHLVFLLSGCLPKEVSPQTDEVARLPTQETQQIVPSGSLEESNQFPEFIDAQDPIILIEEVVVILLLLSTIVGITAQQLRMPYTVGLVMMGLLLTLLPQVDIHLEPSLFLGLLVPPLVFEGAFHLNYNDLRRNLLPILTFAVPGVVLTMLIVGAVVNWGTSIPFTYALIFGAIVAAIDPVAVIALFRTMGVPKRLEVLLEGESLMNDGTAIVLYSLVVPIALGSIQVNPLTGLLEFLRVAGGGIVIGLVLGTLISQVISRIDDYLIETTLTTILAFGSYLVAEQLFHVSGVLAVMAAGLVNGNIGPTGMSPTTRIVLFNFWEYASFIANSIIFLLIGLQIDLAAFLTTWQFILIAISGVLLARAVTIYGLSWVGRDIPLRWQHILNWGGLRGAISLALAVSLPLTLGAYRTQLQVMTFGVVVFTLLIQGLTMAPLVRWLKITPRSEAQEEYERRHARAVATRAAYDHLARMRRIGLISDHSWGIIAPLLEQHNKVLIEATREVITRHPELQQEEMELARRELLQAQRSTLSSLLKTGVISEENYSLLVSEVDAALTTNITNWPDIARRQTDEHPSVTRLIAAIIQESDLENALSALTKLGFSVTQLPSSGGFLGRRNITLLIGITEGQERTAFEALSKSCKRRVEYLATPLEAGSMALPTPIPVDVGGATIFVFQVDRFVEF